MQFNMFVREKYTTLQVKNFFQTYEKIVDICDKVEYNIIEQLKKCSIDGGDMTEQIKKNSDTVQAIRDALPDDEVIYNLADFFKMFGDSTRAKILQCLQFCDLYVSEIADVLGMSISAVSHQLRVLRSAKLVKGTKEGKEVKYSLDDDHITKILEFGLTHVNE